MDFKLTLADGDTLQFSGTAKFNIASDTGVLTVTDETGRRTSYSPSGWLSVAETEPRKAGNAMFI